jgi:ribonucleoside-triphosphate reductase
MSIALARTPAETTAQRFAVSDLIHDIKNPKESWNAEKYVKGNVEIALRDLAKGIRDVPVEYSNGTHCAVNAPITINRKAEIESKFFEVLKGGNIFHIFFQDISPFLTLDTVVDSSGKRVPFVPSEYDIKDVMEFGLNLAKNTNITYFAFSKDTTICMDCNATSCGIHEKCPRCLSENVDHIARITGYNSTVSGWNEAKKQELKDRHRYNASIAA